LRFIVTGGAGFIGSSFIEKALESNHQVIAIDNLSSGRIENIEPFQKHRNFSFLHHDLSTSFPRELINLPKAEGFICHFAAQVGVESVVRGVSESIRNNIHVSEQVVKFSSDHEIPVLFTSSSEIYGKSQSIPTSEHDDRIMQRLKFSMNSFLRNFGSSKRYQQSALDFSTQLAQGNQQIMEW
jgi:UDP-glucose 4-epimerase